MLHGLVKAGRPRLGIIRLPALDTLYTGQTGVGAHKNGRAISTSRCHSLDQATLFINEPEKIHARQPDLFGRLCHAGRLRRMSYDCYPHALVAEGRIDAVVDYDLKPYDFLPVAAVVEAAGGLMTDWQGKPLDFASDGCVVSAATPEVHADLLALLNR